MSVHRSHWKEALLYYYKSWHMFNFDLTRVELSRPQVIYWYKIKSSYRYAASNFGSLWTHKP
jgi:hypothetical protein